MESDLVRGVPEFLFREAVTKFVDEVRKHVKAFILQSKSSTEQERRDAINEANESLKQLEEEAFELLEKKLWHMMQSV